MRIVFGLALLGAACVVACGSSSKGSPGSGGADANGGDTGDGTAGKGHGSGGKGSSSGGAGNGDAGDTGDAGSNDVPVVSNGKPHAAGGLVAGGVVAHSAHFTGVFSLGAAPGGNGVSTSKSSQLRGGVIGASQK